MESITKFASSWSYSRELAANTTIVVGNPHLIAGFLLGYLLLGLIIVILAFWSQRSKLRVFKERIVVFCTGRDPSLRPVQNLLYTMLSLLVLFGIINSVTAVVLAVYFILLTCGSACNIVFMVWLMSKSYVIVLHLLCALMSVLHLCHPHWRVQLQIISSVVCFMTAVFVVLYYFIYLVGFIGLAVITFGLALAIIAKSFGSTASPSAAASKRWIVFVAMFTFLVIYLPTFISYCLMISSTDDSEVQNYAVIYFNLLFGTNIQLALDGFLCLFILRLPAGVEEQQQQHSMERPPSYSLEDKSVTIIQHGDASPPFPVWPSSQSNLRGEATEKR